MIVHNAHVLLYIHTRTSVLLCTMHVRDLLQLATKGKITTSGTYIPPKSQSESGTQQQARQQVSTAGTYVPPETTEVKGETGGKWRFAMLV